MLNILQNKKSRLDIYRIEQDIFNNCSILGVNQDNFTIFFEK